MNTSSQTRPPDPGQSPADVHRERLMAATSVQEQLIAELPAAALPERIGTYDTHPRWPLETIGVEVRYWNRPAAVQILAELLGEQHRTQHVTSHVDGSRYIQTSVDGVYHGVGVHAWTHTPDPDRPAPPTAQAPDLVHVPATAPAPVTPQPLTVKAAADTEQTMPITPQTTGTEGGERGE